MRLRAGAAIYPCDLPKFYIGRDDDTGQFISIERCVSLVNPTPEELDIRLSRFLVILNAREHPQGNYHSIVQHGSILAWKRRNAIRGEFRFEAILIVAGPPGKC